MCEYFAICQSYNATQLPCTIQTFARLNRLQLCWLLYWHKFHFLNEILNWFLCARFNALALLLFLFLFLFLKFFPILLYVYMWHLPILIRSANNPFSSLPKLTATAALSLPHISFNLVFAGYLWSLSALTMIIGSWKFTAALKFNYKIVPN